MEVFNITTEFAHGTSCKEYIEVSYPRLIELFGEPSESDGYKVSGEYTFKAPNGELVTLYDWKSTDLYDIDYPRVSELRADSSVELHIGAKDKVTAGLFKEWLKQKLQG